MWDAVAKFQSTLPHGSDRYETGEIKHIPFISIHAPSRERPGGNSGAGSKTYNFNPRSLTGATPRWLAWKRRMIAFQSTLPHGSDAQARLRRDMCKISIHAPSRERRLLITTTT